MTNEKQNQSASFQIGIRNAIPHDIPQLTEMISALAAHHGDVAKIDAGNLKLDIFGKIPWIYVIVAEQYDTLIGYAALCPLIQLQFGVRGIDMHHLFVDKKFRGCGLGRRLIKASISKTKALGGKYMMVATNPDNTVAQAVYLACGFETRPGVAPSFRVRFD